jgi:hypothetical protein
MADEHDELPDTTRIVSDIQKAMSAYGEFQMQLADAMKPWQNQWAALQEQLAPLLSAIEPIQEEVTTAAIKWCAVQESWQEHSAAIQDAAARWAGAWTEAQAAIARELAEIGPRLRRTLENAANVGRLGWTVTMKMMPIDMSTLADMQTPADADAYMLEWYEKIDPNVDGLEARILDVEVLELFRTPLSQCFTAYRRGDFAVGIPLLVAALECGIRNFVPTERFFSTDVPRMVKGRYDKAKENAPQTVEAFFWMSLYAFVQWFYVQYGPRNSAEDRIFRNGIQHGTQPPPNEKVEALRLLHALDTVAALYKRSGAASPTV